MARLFTSIVAVAATLLFAGVMVNAEDKPFRRLQVQHAEEEGKAAAAHHNKRSTLFMKGATTGSASSLSALFEAKNAAVPSSDMLDAVQPDTELAMMQDVWKNGADPVKLFQDAFNSEGFKLISDNAEVQHRILEAFPLLAAYDGFKQARGRKLSDEDTKASFASGIKNMLSVTADAMTKIKDPSSSIRALTELASSPDKSIQDLFMKATDGDKAAVDEIEGLLNQKQFPGIDTTALKELAASNPIQKLIDNKEVMRFIDEDPVVSQVIRNPLDLDSFVAAFAASRKH